MLRSFNVAIPRVHTHNQISTKRKNTNISINYENVAIPEVHIRTKEK